MQITVLDSMYNIIILLFAIYDTYEDDENLIKIVHKVKVPCQQVSYVC